MIDATGRLTLPQESITLTNQADIEWVRAKVRDGEFESETHALAVGVSRLREDEQEREARWQQFGKAAYESYKADSSAVYTFEEVHEHLAATRNQRPAETESC